ncbi:hypothetical protein COCVIDRAFT_32444 [Bipolaris victoriae FI3]|uniref:Uncharacterized protein n=1 Tax=Bipolaris victoriae (strain FI3) TaxID=930091 RepID=W7FB06_BIPV3|nr:hypothetical protein COCVIDRAFT_32444 [Bipolaris victoriae FI3]
MAAPCPWAPTSQPASERHTEPNIVACCYPAAAVVVLVVVVVVVANAYKAPLPSPPHWTCNVQYCSTPATDRQSPVARRRPMAAVAATAAKCFRLKCLPDLLMLTAESPRPELALVSLVSHSVVITACPCQEGSYHYHQTSPILHSPCFPSTPLAKPPGAQSPTHPVTASSRLAPAVTTLWALLVSLRAKQRQTIASVKTASSPTRAVLKLAP